MCKRCDQNTEIVQNYSYHMAPNFDRFIKIRLSNILLSCHSMSLCEPYIVLQTDCFQAQLKEQRNCQHIKLCRCKPKTGWLHLFIQIFAYSTVQLIIEQQSL